MKSYETLRVEREGRIGRLVFDRPEAGNAMDATMFAELERAWRELDADPHVRVIVDTGEGAAFQTGLDLELGLTDACRAGVEELVAVWGHADQLEGPLAFFEKREPMWQELR